MFVLLFCCSTSHISSKASRVDSVSLCLCSPVRAFRHTSRYKVFALFWLFLLFLPFRARANRNRLQIRAGREGAVCDRRGVCHGSCPAQHAEGPLSWPVGRLWGDGARWWQEAPQVHPIGQLQRWVHQSSQHQINAILSQWHLTNINLATHHLRCDVITV